jgi:hypothetical protein
MKKVKFAIIIITLIVPKVCLAQPELNTTLAPHLSISTKLLHDSIVSEHIQKNGYFRFVVRPGFLMHLRPFELLCDLSRVISEKEGISIQLNILDEHKQRVAELIYPLEEISAQFLKNDLHVYREDVNPVIESFTGVAHGVFYMAKKHYFEIIIQPKLFKGEYIPSKHIILFFEQFFRNQLTRKDGSIIDISFDRDDPSNGYHLNPDDLEYLTMQFGDKDFLPLLSSDRLSSGNGSKALERYLQEMAVEKKIFSKTNSETIEKSI